MAEGARRRLPRANLGDVLLVAVATGLVAFVGLAGFLAPRGPDAGRDALAATTVDETTLPQTVPFRYVAGHIIIDALAGGSTEPVPFILDSAAPTSYSHAAADLFASEAVGTVSIRTIDGSILEVDVVNVGSLRIGGAVFDDVAGTRGVIKPDNPLSCLSEYGLIGANLLRTAVWQIDYDAREITISSSVDGLDHVDGAITFPFGTLTRAAPTPVLTFLGDHGRLRFILDTGSSGGLTSNPADLEAIGVTVDASGPKIDVIVAGGAGTFETTVTYAGVDLELDGTSHEDYPVATTDSVGRREGIIGNGFLDGFVVTIDWPSGKLYLDPVLADGSIPMPPDPLGANLSWDGRNPIIGSIVPGSTAAEVGLRLGEAVSRITTQDHSYMALSEFCALRPGEPPQIVSVTTVRGVTYAFEPVVGFFDPLGE